MSAPKEHLAIWLLPQDQEAENLRQIIRWIAEECSTPIFEPHVTLISGLRAKPDDVAGRLQTLAERRHSFLLSTGRPELYDEFFRSIVVPVFPSERLAGLRRDACRLLGVRVPLEFRPHFSLAYGAIPVEVKRRVVEQTGASVPSVVRISTLAVVRASSELDVGSWTICRRMPLKAAK